MAERMGPRRPDEIEKEPPGEFRYIQPTDQPSDTTPPNVQDDIDDTTGQPSSRMEPFGPRDKEAARWNLEEDLITDNAAEQDQDAYLKDVARRMYEPSDTSGEVPTETPSNIREAIDDDSEPGIDTSDQEP